MFYDIFLYLLLFVIYYLYFIFIVIVYHTNLWRKVDINSKYTILDAIFLLVTVCEELVFRGYIKTRLNGLIVPHWISDLVYEFVLSIILKIDISILFL